MIFLSEIWYLLANYHISASIFASCCMCLFSVNKWSCIDFKESILFSWSSRSIKESRQKPHTNNQLYAVCYCSCSFNSGDFKAQTNTPFGWCVSSKRVANTRSKFKPNRLMLADVRSAMTQTAKLVVYVVALKPQQSFYQCFWNELVARATDACRLCPKNITNDIQFAQNTDAKQPNDAFLFSFSIQNINFNNTIATASLPSQTISSNRHSEPDFMDRWARRPFANTRHPFSIVNHDAVFQLAFIEFPMNSKHNGFRRPFDEPTTTTTKKHCSLLLQFLAFCRNNCCCVFLICNKDRRQYMSRISASNHFRCPISVLQIICAKHIPIGLSQRVILVSEPETIKPEQILRFGCETNWVSMSQAGLYIRRKTSPL